MLEGESGIAQVPDPAKRLELLRRSLSARAGLDGARVKDIRAMLCAVRSYAVSELGIADADAADEACRPDVGGACTSDRIADARP